MNDIQLYSGASSSDPDDGDSGQLPVLVLEPRMVAKPSSWQINKAILNDRRSRGAVVAVVLLTCVLLATLVWIAALQFNERYSGATFHFDQQELTAQKLEALPASPESSETDLLKDIRIGAEGEDAVILNAKAPFANLGPKAARFEFTGDANSFAQARACLASTMLYEAGNDPVGQYAVGQVVLNRVRHPAFPSTVCGVVLQGSERVTGCQFTFTCDGALARRYPAALVAGATARADMMLNGFVEPRVGLATHYHTDQVYPAWSPQLDKVARVGSHLFFRWRGYWGTTPAFAQKYGGAEAAGRKLAFFGAADSTNAADLDLVEFDQATSFDLPDRAPSPAGGAPVQSDASTELASRTAAERIPEVRRLPTRSAGQRTAAAPVLSSAAISGNEVVRFFDDNGTFFLALKPGQSSAEKKKIAGLLCGGREVCRVYGWRSGSKIPVGPVVSQGEREGLELEFVRGASKPNPS